MPGHIKLVKGAVDPDPTEYLLPSNDMKKSDQNKPYEPKKSVWVSCVGFILWGQRLYTQELMSQSPDLYIHIEIIFLLQKVPCPKTGGYREGFLESGGDIANIGAEDADLTVKLVVVSGTKSLRLSQNLIQILRPWDMRNSPTSKPRLAGLTPPSSRNARTWST